VAFLPHRPYIPLGTLREAITYPLPPDRFADEEIRAALSRLRLDRLAASLDRNTGLDQEMTIDEQQRIALVRMLLQRPEWIIQDEAMSELDDDNRLLAEELFRKELAHAALISIGRRTGNGHSYQRILELQLAQPGIVLPMSVLPPPQPEHAEPVVAAAALA
jgi:vitamin B12/bleomycin/antimicrobial peptide transport system ATP-binding/permease protein